MSPSALNKRIVIIAGPNGAGKTTFAREFLPSDAELPNFERYKQLVDSWQLYDNSDTPAVLVEEGQNK